MTGGDVTIGVAMLALVLGIAAVVGYVRVRNADRRAEGEAANVAARVAEIRQAAKDRPLEDLAPSERIAVVEALSDLPLRGYVRNAKVQQLLVQSERGHTRPLRDRPPLPNRPRMAGHVRKHLQKNAVDPDALPDNIIETLNKFTDDELNKLEVLGTSLREAKAEPEMAAALIGALPTR